MPGNLEGDNNTGKSDLDDLIFGFFIFPLFVATLMLILFTVSIYVVGLQ